MKRLFAFLMVLAMALSLSVTAFATENTGSITITNATVGEDYAAYQIFKASLTTGSSGISYTIEEDSPFFDALFNNDDYKTATDPHYNPFFVYNSSTGGVTKRADVNNAELIAHLKKLIYDEKKVEKDGKIVTEYTLKDSVKQYAAASTKASSEEVVFDDLPYGYYLLTSSLGTTVTIDSNNPDVEVIDKNQDPANDFNKKVLLTDAEGNPLKDSHGNELWDDANSAGIGDKVTYKIEFTATNYDGDKPIQYYQVHDTKGDALWAEFESIEVSVGGETLTKGYYLALGGDNTHGWQYLGTGWGDNKPTDTSRVDEAQWYLVHLDYDKFRITIPWMTNHEVVVNKDVSDPTKIVSYTLEFDKDPLVTATSKYDSPSTVVIKYESAVEPGAAIGDQVNTENRNNKAHASWTSTHETDSTPDDEVVTYVYGLGILKDDTNTGVNLAGAKFRLYSDAACTKPVYVIPTDIDGVYMVDSEGKYINNVTGEKKESAREWYGHNMAEYLKDDEGNPLKDKNGNLLTQDNRVISQANGKLVVLGLAKGTYYLVEVEAPAGYNALTTPVTMAVGEDTRPFYVFANSSGQVADIQAAKDGYLENEYQLTHTKVGNSTGTLLPSTGGEGAMKMITIGAIVALAFAILLITNKKMTAYQD